MTAGRHRAPSRAAAVAALVAAVVGAAARAESERPERERAGENDLTEVRHDEGR